MNEQTEKQIEYVRKYQRRSHLSDRALDAHCVRRFRAPLAELDRAQVSDLLGEMVGWESIPADMQRARGQLDLFGVTK